MQLHLTYGTRNQTRRRMQPNHLAWEESVLVQGLKTHTIFLVVNLTSLFFSHSSYFSEKILGAQLLLQGRNHDLKTLRRHYTQVEGRLMNKKHVDLTQTPPTPRELHYFGYLPHTLRNTTDTMLHTGSRQVSFKGVFLKSHFREKDRCTASRCL